MSSFVKLETEYLTVPQTAEILGLSDDFVRRLVVDLLEIGVFINDDVLEVHRPGAIRKVRKHYRILLIHKDKGIEKIKRYFTPTSRKP